MIPASLRSFGQAILTSGLAIAAYVAVVHLTRQDAPPAQPPEAPMPFPSKQLAYRPVIDHVIRVKDGDTVDLMLDLGFDTYRKQTVRLQGIDTPENNTEAGKAVAVWLTRYLARESLARPMYLDSREYDKYGGRVLGDIYFDRLAGPSLVQYMFQLKLGKPYSGGKRHYWTPADLAVVLAAAQAP